MVTLELQAFWEGDLCFIVMDLARGKSFIHEDLYCPYCLSQLFAYVNFQLFSDISGKFQAISIITFLAIIWNYSHTKKSVWYPVSSISGGDLHGKLEPGTGLGPEVASRRLRDGPARSMAPWETVHLNTLKMYRFCAAGFSTTENDGSYFAGWPWCNFQSFEVLSLSSSFLWLGFVVAPLY